MMKRFLLGNISLTQLDKQLFKGEGRGDFSFVSRSRARS